ncbi:MAG TPA: SDR family NAD(P)-dependent oxidoreductase [Afifellaceae bacterium]|nr:SDR family NAD(P)-dependent oxidoreductase [Afifellaceae bacterium]
MVTPVNAWQTAWIIGASSGIGRELARLLDGKIGHVAVSARSEDKLEKLAAQCATVVAYPLDVTDADAVAVGVGDIEAAAGPIDLAVLNAGTWQLMDVAELDLSAIRTGIEVNYMGVVHAINALLPGMIARGRGHIAIVASVAGYRGLPRSAAYGPTKAALINLAETLRIELAPRGITISLVNPGFVDTPMTRDNPFPMPFIIPAQQAAQSLLAGLQRQKSEIIFPRTFVFAMKLLRLMPNAVYFWVIRTLVMKNET